MNQLNYYFYDTLTVFDKSIKISIKFTKKVTGVVGRAELLSSLLLLWALMVCQRESWTSQLVSVTLCVASTLAKEQGFMSFALCIFVNASQRMPVQKLIRNGDHKNVFIYLRGDSARYIVYVIPAAVTLFLRYRLMNGELPVFTRYSCMP